MHFRLRSLVALAMAALVGCATDTRGGADEHVDGGMPAECGPGDSGCPGDGDGGSAADAGEADGGGAACGDGICDAVESPRECTEDCGPEATLVDGRWEENVPAPRADLDAYVRGEMDAQALVGMGIGVVRDGRVLYLKGYGHQDVAGDVPVTSYRTMFRWASAAKMLTGIVGVKLESADRLDLDAPIETYYADYQCPSTYYAAGAEMAIPPAARVVTTRQLLGHLAGIRHYTNAPGNPSPSSSDANDPSINTGIQWAVEIFQDWPLVAIPGEEYSYSTFGMNLAGVAMEHAADTSFAALVDVHIAMPAGLGTLQPDYEWAAIDHRAVGYDAAGTDVGSSDVSWKQPGGGFISTVEDFAQLCAALMDDTLLSDAEKTAVWTPQVDGSGASIPYGMGFRVGSRDGRAYVEHSGSQQKARTRLRYYREDALCIVMMSNSAQADTYLITRGIEDVVRAW